jgi:hypothetical protein
MDRFIIASLLMLAVSLNAADNAAETYVQPIAAHRAADAAVNAPMPHAASLSIESSDEWYRDHRSIRFHKGRH